MGLIAAIGFFVIYFVIMMLIRSSLDGIFKTALYIYAKPDRFHRHSTREKSRMHSEEND